MCWPAHEMRWWGVARLSGVALTPLGSAAEVLVATGHDPFTRGSLRRPDVRGWVADGAVAWIGTDAEERVPYLSALGAPERVAALLADHLVEGARAHPDGERRDPRGGVPLRRVEQRVPVHRSHPRRATSRTGRTTSPAGAPRLLAWR